jgi:hypothetical protein
VSDSTATRRVGRGQQGKAIDLHLRYFAEAGAAAAIEAGRSAARAALPHLQRALESYAPRSRSAVLRSLIRGWQTA